MIYLSSSCDVAHLEGSLCGSSDSSVECTLTPVVLDVRVCPRSEEFLDIVSAGTDSGEVESSPAIVIGGIQLHSGAEKNIHGAVEGGSGEGARGAAGVRVGDHLHVLGNGREEEAIVFAVFTGRIGGAAAARREWEAVGGLLGHGQHERGVPSGARGVHVPLLGVVPAALLQEAPHDLRVAYGAVVEVVPLARVFADLRDNRHVRGVMTRGIADWDFVVGPGDL